MQDENVEVNILDEEFKNMQPLIIPKLGLTMDEGTVVRWHKKEGDTVEKGDILFEVETDKAINEVESPSSGTFGKALIKEGETAAVLQVIGYLLEPGESPPEAWPEPEAPAETLEKPETAQATKVKTRATPVALRLARERGMNLTQIEGTGKYGTITKEDILHFQEKLREEEKRPRRTFVASPRAKRLAKEKGISLEGIKGTGPRGRIREDDVISIMRAKKLVSPSRIQTITAERLTRSFTTVPHFYLHIELDASELVAWREELLPAVEESVGVHLTYTDMLVLSVAKALENHPHLNASWVEGNIHMMEAINLGIATAIDEGLVVPVIKNTNQKDLAEIAQERKRLAEKAQERKLGVADLEGGTFTLTNLGMFGVDDFDAIINPPQSAILAVGRIAERPFAERGIVVVKPTLRFSLSIDHRVLDGAVAARFLDDLKRLVESPQELFKSGTA